MYTCKNEIRLYDDASEELLARLRRTHMLHRGQERQTCFWLTNAEPRLLTVWQCSDIQTDPKGELASYLTAMHCPAEKTVQTLHTVRDFYEALREGHNIGLCGDARKTFRQYMLLPFADRTKDDGVWEEPVEPLPLTDAEAADESLRAACLQASDAKSGLLNCFRIGAHSIDYAKQQGDRLLSHLAAIGRLPGCRAIYLTPAFVQLSDEELKCIYANQEGCAVVILLDEYRVVDDTMDETLQCLNALSTLAGVYRDKVTTVVCAGDRVDVILTDIYQLDVDSVRIEASYPNVNGMDVCDFWEARRRLNRLARQHGQCKCELPDSFDYLGRFRIDDLPRMYDELMSGKKVPEAKPRRRKKSAAKPAESSGKMEPDRKRSAMEELEAMIGLTEAKRTIRQFIDRAQVQILMRQQGLTAEMPCLHMAFTGNPGTAKTTVARLTACILQECGILPVGKLVEVGRADLVGCYVGSTARLVKEKFEEARGSVLFIDEAYSLLDDQNGGYGDEAVNTIVQEMENHREDTVVIFAGYREEMETFLSRNPGLRSRVPNIVDFPDYSLEELQQIVTLKLREKGLLITADAQERVESILRSCIGKPDFGNGRFARTLVEQAMLAQASRLMQGEPTHLTENELCTLTAEDFRTDMLPGREPERKHTIGFCLPTAE